MMIAIAGLGMSGSLLYRLLSQEGIEAVAHDPRAEGSYVPCGYATNASGLRNVLSRVGLEAEKYIEVESRNVTFATESGSEITLPARGLCTIDKNRLERDLIEGLEFHRSRAPLNKASNDVMVDATGVSRYYLGPAPGDFLMHTKEYLTQEKIHDDFYFRYFSSGSGYYWEFPLGYGNHVGAGGDSPDKVRGALDWVSEHSRVLSRKIRLSPLFDHMFNGNVIGIGEAIGTVSPITGEGILPSMESAELLFEQLRKHDDHETVKEKYQAAVKRKFARYEKLHSLLMAARNGELRKLGNLGALRSAREDFENFGIEFRIGRILRQVAFR